MKFLWRRVVGFTLSAALSSSLLWANPGADFVWRNFSPSNTGIPGDRILFADFDPLGRMWVGACNATRTTGGVARFDGRCWTTWSNLDSPLPSPCVFSAAFDHSGVVWLGTDGGLVRVDGPYWLCFNSGNSPLPPGEIHDLQLDAAGHLWMTYRKANGLGGVAMLDRGAWTLWSAADLGFDLTTRPASLAIDAAGDVWVGSDPAGGIAHYNWAQWTVLSAADGYSDAAARGLRRGGDGQLWLNWNGVKRYDGQAWQPLTPPPSVRLGTTIRAGADGGVWLGAAVGQVAYHRAGKWRSWDLGTPLTGLTVAPDGRAWCATVSAVQRLSATGGGRIWNNANTGLGDWGIRALSFDQRGRAWIATANNGLSVFDGTCWQGLNPLCGTARLWPFETPRALDVLCADDGSVWVALGEEGLGCWNGTVWTHYLRGETVTCLAESRDGSVWAGLGTGAARYDGMEFTVFGPGDGLPGATATAICAAGANDIYLGTNAGLAHFDGAWRVVEGARPGMPQPGVTALAADGAGVLWVGTDDGLARFDGGAWEHFSENNSGLPAGAVTSLACSDEGELWVGAYDNLNWPHHGGVARYDGLDWATFTPSNTPLPSERVSGLAVDAAGNVWIGTADNGLARLRRAPVPAPGPAVFAAARPASPKARAGDERAFSAVVAGR